MTQSFRFAGIDIGSRMTIVRLPSGALVLISPVELNEQGREALEKLGPVSHIIAPNLFHYLSIRATQSAYPAAQVWGVTGLREKCPDINVDQWLAQPGSFEGTLDYLPFQGLKTIMPNGIKPANETVFYHRPSQTLILTDIAYHFDQNSSLGTQFAAKVLLGTYNSLMPSRLEKMATRDKTPIKTSVQQVLAWDFDRVIPGHGTIVETGGKEQFKTGYEWFLEHR